MKTEAGAGCGLQGEFLPRGPLNHQHVHPHQRKMVLAGGARFEAELPPGASLPGRLALSCWESVAHQAI